MLACDHCGKTEDVSRFKLCIEPEDGDCDHAPMRGDLCGECYRQSVEVIRQTWDNIMSPMRLRKVT